MIINSEKTRFKKGCIVWNKGLTKADYPKKQEKTIIKMHSLTETEKAYIAGLIDGEGCVSIGRNKSDDNIYQYVFSLRVIVTNSHLDTIYWLQDITGIGCVLRYSKAHNPKWKLVHRWQVVGKQALGLLNEVKPYLQIKKDICDIALSFPFHTRGGFPRTKELYTEQNKVFVLAKDKNKRGL